MQPDDSQINPADSNSDLELPCLPYGNIDDLLASSRTICRSQSLIATMSSVADDSSIADSVSSIGQMEWEDLGREADSDAYPEESISRVPTPSVDVYPLPQVPKAPTPEMSDTVRLVPDHGECSESEAGQEKDNKEQKDVELYSKGQEDFQITFAEDRFVHGTNVERDVLFPVAQIVGDTARGYLQGTSWQDLDHISGAVKMKMGIKRLPSSRPFKLFYVGDEMLRHVLAAKIGSALIAARDDTDYGADNETYETVSVMPISLNKDSPHVALVPKSSTNMELETCIKARYVKDNRETIELHFQSGTIVSSRYDGRLQKYVVDRDLYQLPDLAIIHIPEDETQDVSLRLRVRQFLNRHFVPTIIISSSNSWEAPSRPLTIDPRTPHLVVQVPGMSVSESAVFKRLPIDVDNFLRLNSLQLNRNLACLIPELRLTPKPKPMLDQFRENCHHVWAKALVDPDTPKYIFAALACVLVLFSAELLSALTGVQQLAAVNQSGVSVSSVISTGTKTTITLTAATPVVTSSIVPSNSLSIVADKALASIPESASEPNLSEQFTAEVYADSLIVIRPPQWHMKMKRAPALNFTVLKNGEPISFDTAKISDKIEAISIPKEHAHGIVSVHIRLINVPKKLDLKNQTIDVDLGSAWAKFFDWMKATHQTPEEPVVKSEEPVPHFESPPWQDLRQTWMSIATSTFDQLRHQTADLAAHIQNQTAHWRRNLVASREDYRAARELRRKESKEVREQFAQAVQEKVAEAGEAVREYRETHFVQQQIDLLKLWWRVRGGPPEEAEPRVQLNTTEESSSEAKLRTRAKDREAKEEEFRSKRKARKAKAEAIWRGFVRV